MPPRYPTRGGATGTSPTTPDPNNLLLRCIQCRRPIEILAGSSNSSGGVSSPVVASSSSSSSSVPSSSSAPASAESLCRALYSCAVKSSQDIPMCSSCWKQRIAGPQQASLSELSSLVETLSTVRDISNAAIAAFKDFDIEVDDLTQEYVVVRNSSNSNRISGSRRRSSSSRSPDRRQSSPLSPTSAAAADAATRRDDEQYMRERAELEQELLETERELAAKRREVRQLQASLSKFNAEADGIERQLNGVVLQESAVENAAASAASRLQLAKAGFSRLGLAVSETVSTVEVAAAAQKGRQQVHAQQSRSPAAATGSEGDNTATVVAAAAPAADIGSSAGNHTDETTKFTRARQAAASITAASATGKEGDGHGNNGSNSTPVVKAVSASLDSLAGMPTVALFTITPSQVNFETMNNVTSMSSSNHNQKAQPQQLLAATNLSSVLSATFHLEFDDNNIARCNGRRIGRLPVTPVADDEINAGCGFLSLLMNYLLNTYTRMEKTLCSMDPQGCASTITIFAPNQKRSSVDFHIKRRFFSWSTFGQAWVHFAACTHEVVQSIREALRAKAHRVKSNSSFAPSTASAQLVQRIEEHIAMLQSLPKIVVQPNAAGAKVDEDSVKYGDASDQQWTAAVRGILKLLSWSIAADRYLNE